MKIKYLLGALIMALIGAAIALFAYTKIMDRPAVGALKDSSTVELAKAKAYLTSLQSQEGQVDFTYAAEETVHAVVHVHVKMAGSPDNPLMDWFYGDRNSKRPEVSGYGSGVIISSDGYIITNNHVVENAESVEVTLNDKRTFTADVVGRDEATDIALIKIKADNLPLIKYGDSEELKLGEWVLAVGNPFNLTSTVTAGIVSAKGRSLPGLSEGSSPIESFIQTDAALNMGNSGGALVNTKGLLVGITSAIFSPTGAYAGNSFAIPVTIVKKVVEDLKEFGHVQRALIGVNIQDIDYALAEKLKLNAVRGILITRVIDQGSAKEAGLKENDVILKFDGRDVNTVSELQEQVGKHRPGDKGTVTYFRNGKETTVPIVLKNSSGNTKTITAASIEENEVFGATLEPLSADEMGSLKINYGVRVADINEGKFKEIGMSKGYIILAVNGKKVRSAADVKDATNNEKTLKTISGIQTDGTMLNYQFGN
jgi:serine protease Do